MVDNTRLLAWEGNRRASVCRNPGRDHEAKPGGSSATKHPAPPIWDIKEHPRYEPGVYEVRCVKVEWEWLHIWRRWSCRLECVFTLEPVPGGRVSGFLNMGNDRNRPRVGRQSRFSKLWIRANKTAPRKRQEMSPNIFVGKFFRVRIGHTTHDSDNNEHPEALVYSTIKEWIDVYSP